MDGGAWWAAVYGVAQSRTRLKRLSSSSSSSHSPPSPCFIFIIALTTIWSFFVYLLVRYILKTGCKLQEDRDPVCPIWPIFPAPGTTWHIRLSIPVDWLNEGFAESFGSSSYYQAPNPHIHKLGTSIYPGLTTWLSTLHVWFSPLILTSALGILSCHHPMSEVRAWGTDWRCPCPWAHTGSEDDWIDPGNPPPHSLSCADDSK